MDKFDIPDLDMLALEQRVQRALATGDESELDVLGYGEVTLVLSLRAGGAELACKRLPLFPTKARFARYRDTLHAYLPRLRAAGVVVAPTRLWHTVRSDGQIAAYCVQHALDRRRTGQKWLASASETEARWFFGEVLAAVEKACSPMLGVDVQASNWNVGDEGLVFLDVTTPFVRDAEGREQLDVKLFMTSLPWLLREPVRWTMSKSLFDKFYSPRGAVLDLLGNLKKDGLERLIPSFLEMANARLAPPLTAAEVDAYYAEDAKMWALLQRLRRADRWWQRAIRRRAYPFLLPRAIAR